MNPIDIAAWSGNWAWGLPLIVLNTVFHVCGLALISETLVHRLSGSFGRPGFMSQFAIAMSVIALLVAVLHGIEGIIWAVAYRLLGALADNRSAMLYSLSAITSFGHANLFLKPHWQLMGALEALNGMLLFGLTTAFLFAMIQVLWPLGSRKGRD